MASLTFRLGKKLNKEDFKKVKLLYEKVNQKSMVSQKLKRQEVLKKQVTTNCENTV